MSDHTVVQLRNVTKKIGSKTIVDRLSFDVPRGEVFGFLGPNGAGKTTTIRMMVGLMAMTEGEVLVNGISVNKRFEEAMRHVGAIVENPELYKFLTGYQNLLHFARMIPGITRERIDEAVALVKLDNRIHDKVKTYSLGMRQRLGVAQAILHKPDVLILDEPTNGLDPEGIRELRDYLRRLAKEEGTAVIVSSHLLSEMELMCDRVAVIQNGRLVDVRAIRDMVAPAEGNVEVAVVAAPADRAAQAAAEAIPGCVVGTDGSGFTASVPYDRIPELVRALVRADVLVYGVKAASKSLEDQFLELTRGGQIV
ncbi:ABC transporter ATP-binding protein [Paenibacillus flagellatus]|uniref:Bacitracin ABC transporter ATP-binding protein n=1 Tax=Paenibacillus flagellatus TaxID=2211139 RepID=A0A2V5KA33_9BACL|nr:ABC transporter ATP-binding protein [Paenibacillus flagellatus]PYI56401.1 bacitracin ABC transporter ATP-binding protein [Paenibacillus flagellatus]